MAWQIAMAPVVGTDFGSSLDAARVDPEGAMDNPHVAEQVPQAVACAKSLVACSCFGDPATTEFEVTITGHANPDHVQPAANEDGEKAPHDYINISIKQHQHVEAAQ